MIYYADEQVTLWLGDALDTLRQMPDGSVDMICTSPPYFGLRDYGTAVWVDADPACEHQMGDKLGYVCVNCGGVKKDRQYGLESTPAEYVETMRRLFAEARRVLANDGTLWLNLGDFYSAAPSGPVGATSTRRAGHVGQTQDSSFVNVVARAGKVSDRAPKNLLMLPERVAMALQDDDWILRNKIVWHKTNAMPSSVNDRLSNRYEHLFLFSKAERSGPAVAPMSDVDAAWLAALVDGEGTITIGRDRRSAKNPKHQDVYQVTISVANTSRPLLEKARRVMNCGSDLAKNNHGINRPVYSIQVSGEQACTIIRAIRPWLIDKETQAGIALALQATQRRRGVAPSSYRSADGAAYKERLWLAIKAANRREEQDLSWIQPEPKGKHVPLSYWFDLDPIREPHTMRPQRRPSGHKARQKLGVLPAQTYSTSQRDEPGVDGHPLGRNPGDVWSIPTRPYPAAHFACVDEETECLTAEGWKRHGDLRVGELAAQFDMETQRLSWGVIEDVARYEVTDQEMVVGRRRDLDMWLTPNHRTIIQRRHPRTRELQPPVIVRADEVLPSHSIPTAAPWTDGGTDPVSREWAELLGWYIAEGHENKRSLAVEIYQSCTANPQHVERIEYLLGAVGAEWEEARAKRQWRGRPSETVAFRIHSFVAARLRELAPGKSIPADALLWSQDLISALVDGLVNGDGHTRKDDGRLMFIQKDPERAGMVQALAVRLGLSATVSRHSSGTYQVFLTEHRTRSFRGTAGTGSALDRERYTGTVWCPKLPHGTWVARRNGRVFITGNTFPIDLPLRCIKAGCKPGGTVLDPFSGSGTTGEAARKLGRKYVGIDLNEAYHRLAMDRFAQGVLTFEGATPRERQAA
ncbi:DNA methyltransferase [Streptomyces chiangmaiensis]